MYNRYIPQPDGSYRRCHHPDQPPRPKPKPQKEEAPCPEPTPPPCCPPPEEPKPAPRPQPRPRENTSVPDFLRQLLPKNFDTSDLIVVLLLLLMAGDCHDDQNTALLTLILYLFL